MSEQLSLLFGNEHGGRRVGAGRPSKKGRRCVLHRKREIHRAYRPVHVTLRARLGSLRSLAVFPAIRDAILAANCARSEAFRVCTFSVQADHLRLIVEAASRSALVEGMRDVHVCRPRTSFRPLRGSRGSPQSRTAS